MGKGKCLIISMAVLGALLAVPPLVAAQDDGPVRINESFVMGDTGYQMNLVLDGDQVVYANVTPSFEPPPELQTGIYAFDFTGSVYFINGAIPFPISINDLFQGTLFYDPSSLTKSDVAPYLAYYGPNDSTIAGIDVSFASGQAFETITLNYSAVYNNNPNGNSDTFFFTAYLSPVPPFSGVDGDISVLFNLTDHTGTVFNGLDYPTILNYADWDEHQFQINFVGSDGSQWQISGLPTSLSPSVSFQAKNKSASPAVQQSTSVNDGTLTVEDISATLICDDNDEDGQPDAGTCLEKTAVERNIMEKSGDGSRYCYYTTTGQRVCKTF